MTRNITVAGIQTSYGEDMQANIDKTVGFIRQAAGMLKRGGALWMVANRHLPYEDVLDARFSEVNEIASSGAFKVIHAVRARATPARHRA